MPLAASLAGLHSAASQNDVSALAVVAGASTAGECAAQGMHTRRARSRLAMTSWVAGGQALSFSPYSTSIGIWLSRASSSVRSGAQSRYRAASTSALGSLLFIRLARNASTGPVTPSATACGSRYRCQISATPARSRRVSGRSPRSTPRAASMARSSSARGPPRVVRRTGESAYLTVASSPRRAEPGLPVMSGCPVAVGAAMGPHWTFVKVTFCAVRFGLAV
ncbi:MAG: hypothetical protein ACRDPY_18435 [Streptosporangiaceae bacterium]